jgi:hypothetical protein
MRIGAYIVLLGVAFFLPFWVYLLGSMIYALRFTFPLELIVLGVLLDASYGARAFDLPFPCIYTLIAFCMCVGVFYIRGYTNVSKKI